MILYAKNKDELLIELKKVNVAVIPNIQQRATEHGERRTISLLLATLATHNYFGYPVTLTKQESPDYYINFNDIDIGIEITEAINQDYAKARTLPEAKSGHTLIDTSLFKNGSPDKSIKQLRNIVKRTKLTGTGWIGNSNIDELTNFMYKILCKKTQKLNLEHFHKYKQNWLVIYDNYNSVILNHEIVELKQSLVLQFQDYWGNNSFDNIFIICNESLIHMAENHNTSMEVSYC